MQPAQPQRTLKLEPSLDGSLIASSSAKCESLEKPLFVMSDWSTRFLPTLYHVLFCSEQPFHEFSKGSSFATTVQEVLDIVHPGNTYTVTTTTKVYTTVQYLFLCPIHFLIALLKCRHMIGSLKNGVILACRLYVWSKHFSNRPNSRETPAQ
jgi:hypothetical protein